MMSDSLPHAAIMSVATAFPNHDADLDYATSAATAISCENETQARKLGKLYRRTGVQRRGSVLLDRDADGQLSQSFYPPLTQEAGNPTMQTRNERFAIEAPRLASQASSKALAEGSIKSEEITHIVTVTCTGFYAPGLDVALIKQLNLPATTQRLALGFMGCHGLINGVRAAEGLLAANPDASVLIASVELCSLHYQYGYDPQSIVSGSIFADGAASMVLSGPANEPSTGFPPSMAVLATGSCLLAESEDAMTWRIGDHGFRMTLDAAVPALIESNLADFLLPWLAKAAGNQPVLIRLIR
ncbi:MAG: type III polyketide synthase, partial [Planctomycetota bacterium]